MKDLKMLCMLSVHMHGDHEKAGKALQKAAQTAKQMVQTKLKFKSQFLAKWSFRAVASFNEKQELVMAVHARSPVFLCRIRLQQVLDWISFVFPAEQHQIECIQQGCYVLYITIPQAPMAAMGVDATDGLLRRREIHWHLAA